jgi:hypothetical protein
MFSIFGASKAILPNYDFPFPKNFKKTLQYKNFKDLFSDKIFAKDSWEPIIQVIESYIEKLSKDYYVVGERSDVAELEKTFHEGPKEKLTQSFVDLCIVFYQDHRTKINQLLPKDKDQVKNLTEASKLWIAVEAYYIALLHSILKSFKTFIKDKKFLDYIFGRDTKFDFGKDCMVIAYNYFPNPKLKENLKGLYSVCYPSSGTSVDKSLLDTHIKQIYQSFRKQDNPETPVPAAAAVPSKPAAAAVAPVVTPAAVDESFVKNANAGDNVDDDKAESEDGEIDVQRTNEKIKVLRKKLQTSDTQNHKKIQEAIEKLNEIVKLEQQKIQAEQQKIQAEKLIKERQELAVKESLKTQRDEALRRERAKKKAETEAISSNEAEATKQRKEAANKKVADRIAAEESRRAAEAAAEAAKKAAEEAQKAAEEAVAEKMRLAQQAVDEKNRKAQAEAQAEAKKIKDLAEAEAETKRTEIERLAREAEAAHQAELERKKAERLKEKEELARKREEEERVKKEAQEKKEQEIRDALAKATELKEAAAKLKEEKPSEQTANLEQKFIEQKNTEVEKQREAESLIDILETEKALKFEKKSGNTELPLPRKKQIFQDLFERLNDKPDITSAQQKDIEEFAKVLRGNLEEKRRIFGEKKNFNPKDLNKTLEEANPKDLNKTLEDTKKKQAILDKLITQTRNEKLAQKKKDEDARKLAEETNALERQLVEAESEKKRAEAEEEARLKAEAEEDARFADEQKRITVDAERVAAEKKAKDEADAAAIVAAAEAKAAAIVAAAKKEEEKLKAEAKAEEERILANTKAEGERILAEAKAKEERILAEAEAREKEILAKAEADKEAFFLQQKENEDINRSIPEQDEDTNTLNEPIPNLDSEESQSNPAEEPITEEEIARIDEAVAKANAALEQAKKKLITLADAQQRVLETLSEVVKTAELTKKGAKSQNVFMDKTQSSKRKPEGSYIVLRLPGSNLEKPTDRIPYGYVAVGKPLHDDGVLLQAFTNRMADIFPLLVATMLLPAKPSLAERALPDVMEKLKLEAPVAEAPSPTNTSSPGPTQRPPGPTQPETTAQLKDNYV